MSKAQELADALDRMDGLLDPSRGLLTVTNDSATAQGSRADMALIRSALSASSEQQAAQQDAALIDVLCGIRQYGLDTLSGRTDGTDDREWIRDAVKVMTSRAAKGIAAARASNGVS